MKRLAGWVVAALVVGAGIPSANAARQAGGDEKKTSVVLYPISLAVGMFSAEVEHKIGGAGGVAGEFKYMNFTVGDWTLKGIGGSVGYRYYASGEQGRGFFVGPYLGVFSNSLDVKYLDSDLTTGKATISATSYGPLAWFGYRWRWNSVVFELSSGISYLLGGDANADYTLKNGTKVSQTYSGRGAGFGWNGLGVGVGMAF